VIDRMLDEFDRGGRLAGAGFYDYVDGNRTTVWPGLKDAFPVTVDPMTLSLKDLEERMMFAEALESVKCLDEGVIESVADANIGSIMGIGFPAGPAGCCSTSTDTTAASPASYPVPVSSPRPTASASSLRPHWSRRPSAARRTAITGCPSPRRSPSCCDEFSRLRESMRHD